MNAITGLGKYLFALPFLAFGAGHFMNADKMAGMAPFGGKAMIYITGVALVLAAISMLIGRMDKLATFLLGLMLLIFAFTIFFPDMTASIPEGIDEAAKAAAEMKKEMAMSGFMKDIALAGAAWMYSNSLAKDNAVIG